jgi:hypothetical protein
LVVEVMNGQILLGSPLADLVLFLHILYDLIHIIASHPPADIEMFRA